MVAPHAENDAAFRPLSDFHQAGPIASRLLLAQQANKPGWWSSYTDVDLAELPHVAVTDYRRLPGQAG
jgi:hypothetical protein